MLLSHSTILRCHHTRAIWKNNLHRIPTFNACFNLKYSQFSTDGSKDINETQDGQLLYRRSANRFNFPRYLLAFSTFQTGYWIWYITDFTPAISAKGVFEVNQSVGGIGLGLSVLMIVGSCIYPRYLISEISLLNKGEVLIKNLTLPFATAEKVGKKYPAGTLKVEGVDRDQLIKKGSILNYNGHLGISNSNGRFPMLLNPKPDEVMNEASLVSLLLPGSLSARDKRELRRQTDEGQESTPTSDGRQAANQRRGYVKSRPKSTRQLPRVRP